MYPYSKAVTPAARSHLDAQFAFFNEMSKTWTQSFQHMFDMNVELGRSRQCFLRRKYAGQTVKAV
jgi:hypothetical protein